MNSQINLLSDLAEITIYQSSRRPTGQNGLQQNNQKQQQDFNFDGAVTKFDRLLTTVFSTSQNDELEPYILKLEEELVDEFGLCISAETNDDLSDLELKIKGQNKVKEVKQELKSYDGLDVSLRGYKLNDTIHQKIVFTDIETKNEVATIPLTHDVDAKYNFYVSMYIAKLIPKFGRAILASLSKQLITTDVAAFRIFDRVSRQMTRNPFAKIANWIAGLKFVDDTYIPIIAGHLLVDNKLSLQSLYTILVSSKLPKRIMDLYQFMSSNGSIDETIEEKGPFVNREINDNERIIVTMIAPSGLELVRTLELRHRIAKKRTPRTTSINTKYRDMVRDFGSMSNELVD